MFVNSSAGAVDGESIGGDCCPYESARLSVWYMFNCGVGYVWG